MNLRQGLSSAIMLGLVLSLAACTGPAPALTATPAPTTTPAPTLTTIPIAENTPCATVTPGSAATSAASAQTEPDLAYQLDVSLNYADHVLTVSQIIDYANTTGRELTELPLIIPPAQTAASFALLSTQTGSDFAQSTFELEGELLQVQLVPSLQPGQHLTLNLLYQIQVPESPSAFGYTERQMLLADWYVFIPPYLPGEGWLINARGAVGEYLAYPLADFSVTLRLSPPQESLVVAASASLLSLDGNCWRYIASRVRNFSFAISPEYQVFSAGSAQADIYAYVFPEHAVLGPRAAAIALEAWCLYNMQYGENPRQFMSIVEGDITDGLECDGMFYLSDSYFNKADDSPQNYFHLLVAHETAHQWFYGLVPNDPANEPWLDESLATYSELLYLETYYPDLVEWWWGYRVQAFAPTGAVNSTIYDFSASRPYINAVYLRGVTFLQALRKEVGDAAFFAALKAYADSSKGDHFRTAEAFFNAFQQNSEANLTHIRAVYFK